MGNRAIAAAVTAMLAASLLGAGSSRAAVVRHDANGTVLVDGAKAFPIILAKGPPLDGRTPTGADALTEVVSAGATFMKVGPATTVWNTADINDAVAWDRAVATHGAYTWVNLSTLSQADPPGSTKDGLLAQAITTLKGDSGSAGLGMWKGADEPFWSKIAPAALQFSYCRSTTRGTPGWCEGEPGLDADHDWVTIEAPRGTAEQLAPYSPVTDAHGVDVYPVTLGNDAPNLHQVGVWTSTLASVTPNHSVWSTLQVCASGSYDTSGHYVLPSVAQERFMVYDAIINGARNLAFYGGNNPSCWNENDNAFQWNWTFWDGVLKPLIQEVNAISPVAPALVNPASNRVLTTSDSTTQAISRAGANDSELWVFVARSGSGSQPVTVTGLPPSLTSGEVYTEGRSIPVTNGSFTDSFPQWGVHVYHFTVPAAPAPPTLSSFSPGSGSPGTNVTISGTNLRNTTAVSFAGTSASYSVTSDSAVSAVVPSGAQSGPVSVTTTGGTATSSASFTVTAGGGPPETTIDSAANGSFSFHGSPSSVRFECKVDGDAFVACGSPASYDLPAGTHTFAVRAIDAAGTADPTPATGSWTVAAPPPPPPPPPPGGGGGSSSGPPDLAVTLTNIGTPRSVGDGVVYKVVVSEPADVPVLADGVTLTFQLPSQTALSSSKVTRGSGCTGTTTLTCNLGFVTPQLTSEAEIAMVVKEPGELVAAASVTNAYGDRNPANNSATLTLRLAPAVPPQVTPRALAAGVSRRGTAARDRLLGTPGPDLLVGLGGADFLSGGAGSDRLLGGPGNDRLLGGPGTDRLFGGAGADRLESRDGTRDVVDCGSGHDLAIVDRKDAVAKSCERIRRP